MDDDLEALDRGALSGEVKRLRRAIRAHRDASGQELCWHHPELWNLLPEKTDPLPAVPAWPQFLRGCLAYRESLDRQLPDAPRTDAEFVARDASRLGDELTRAVDGDPWHGDSAAAILRGVTAAVAAARSREGVHSIWEIVRPQSRPTRHYQRDEGCAKWLERSG